MVGVGVVGCQPSVMHGRRAGQRGPGGGHGEGVGREEVLVIVVVRGGEVGDGCGEALGGWEQGDVGPHGGLEVWLPAGLDGRGLCQLIVAGVVPGDMAGEGLVGGRGQAVALGGAGEEVEVVIEARHVGAFAMAGAAVAGADGVGEQGGFQGRAHQGPRGVGEVGGTRGRVGQYLAIGQAFASDGGLVLAKFFLVFGFDYVE